jgi:hypothetical protein
MIRSPAEKEDVAAPRGIDPRRQWMTIELFAAGHRQVAATLHFEAMDQVRLQFANHACEPCGLFEIIEALKHRRGSASAAREWPIQTSLANLTCIWPLHECVKSQVLEFGVNSIVRTVRKHVDIPALTLQLLDPARGVNALA